MVLKIRLSRWGARNNPFYGIVVANARAPRDGKHLERVGTYNPIPHESTKHVELNVERIKYWLSVGAQPTDRVAWLLAKANLIPPTPKLLHQRGIVNLNDPSTWKVEISDEKGSSLISYQEAQDKNLLPKKAMADNRLDVKGLEFTGKSPTKPLTEQEALIVFKSYLGIS